MTIPDDVQVDGLSIDGVLQPRGEFAGVLDSGPVAAGDPVSGVDASRVGGASGEDTGDAATGVGIILESQSHSSPGGEGGEIGDQGTDGSLGLGVDPDQGDRSGDHLSAVLEADHPVDFDRRRHRLDVVSGDLLDFLHAGGGIGVAVERVSFDDDVGQDSVDPFPHLGGEPGHHAVDHDHGGHPEHHADDAGHRDPAGPQIAEAELELVHGSPLPLCENPVSPSI